MPKELDKTRCTLCDSPKVKREDFVDEASWKEFQFSGFCQECQNKTIVKREPYRG